mgnify:CR=1 FL=1|jgi:hypothetical protein
MKTDVYDTLADASEAFANAVTALGNDIMTRKYDSARFKADYARFIDACADLQRQEDERVRMAYVTMKAFLNDMRDLAARPSARKVARWRPKADERIRRINALIHDIFAGGGMVGV